MSTSEISATPPSQLPQESPMQDENTPPVSAFASVTRRASSLTPLKPVIEQERAKIYHADCLRLGEVVPRSSVTLIVTSPPYPVVPPPEEDYVTFEDPMDFNECHLLLKQVWKVCYDALEDLGRMAVNIYNIPTGAGGMAPNSLKVVKDCLDIGFVLRENYVWDKMASYSPPSGSWPYPCGVLSANSHEDILVFQKPLQFSQRRRDPSDVPKELREASKLSSEAHDWLMASVWRISPDREGRSLGHPFTFPTELCERLIKLYSYAGDTVLDPFVGSGTTVKVASTLGRCGVGFELSDKYIEICHARFAQGSLF